MSKLKMFKAGTILHELGTGIKEQKSTLLRKSICITFPTRLNTMLLDFSKLSANDEMIFPAGEVLISVDMPVRVKISFLDNYRGELKIADGVKRRILALHSYKLMCNALKCTPSLYIDIDEGSIIKHSGLGSSGAITGGICCAINEMFGNPINEFDLIKYITRNYGEEISDGNNETLQAVAAIGGSISTGLFDGGIQVVSGNATPIMCSNYVGKAIIAIAEDYSPRSAQELSELEDKYINENFALKERLKIFRTQFTEHVAYEMLNHALPLLRVGDISGISKLAFDFNFDAGGIEVHEWMYPRMNAISRNVRHLYENGKCDALGKSSVGPAFYALVSNEEDERVCVETFKKENMNTSIVPVYNQKYKIIED